MTDQPLPWCSCPSAEDVHQDSCPRYQELLRREQAWRDGARPTP